MQDIGIDLGRRMYDNDGSPDSATDAAVNFYFLRGNGANDGALAADRDLLANDISRTSPSIWSLFCEMIAMF